MSSNQAQDSQLSLSTAILINVNIMLGAGIFINTPTLAQRAGSLGGLMYILIGILMLPLILTIAQLLRLHPSGGFYTFAQKELNPLAGFLSGWCYFISKLASCMVMIHVSITLIQHIFPTLSFIHPFVLDFLVISLFSILNFLNLKAGSSIQKAFIGFKIFPIFFVLASAVFFLQADNFNADSLLFEGVSSSLPLVIYAVVGFEAACSLSSKIKDAQKNAPLAVLISFGIVILIATLYQSLFYGMLGQLLAQCAGHCDVFPALINKVFGSTAFSSKFVGVIHLAIASSTLGAAYGIIFSNSWNLHILAENNHILFSRYFRRFNKNMIPFACVIAEGVLCMVYLVVSQGVLIPLQQIGALGCVIAYTFSVGALLRADKRNPSSSMSLWIPRLGLLSCMILVTACVRSFFLNGMSSLMTYSILVLIGIAMYQMTAKKSVTGNII